MKKLMLVLLFLIPSYAFAHVKWFSDYSFTQSPLTLGDLTSQPLFWGLFLLSVVSLPLMVWLDKIAEKWPSYVRLTNWLDTFSQNGPLIMRVAMGGVLLMSWQNDTIIAPEIGIPSPWWGWVEFTLILFLFFRRTTFLTGLGIIFFWLAGIGKFGLFHMLDYVVYPAVGLYLILSYMKSEKWKNFDLPVIYSGLGFSLCWVAFEKLFYPGWGLSVLAQAPALTMGLDHQFFLMSCAFIEFTLGYLLMICLLHRPLAIVITLVFFTTTAFFGKPEIVGHTILHGALLVFIVKGPGHYYQAPIRFHKSTLMRSLFAIVNFVVLFLVLAFPYEKLARKTFEESKAAASSTQQTYEVPAGTPAPEISMEAFKDPMGGWNIHIRTKNFRFTPENAGNEDVPGEGHGHVYVNGKKAYRLYGEWFHVTLPRGKNKLRVDLTTNSHKTYSSDGRTLEFTLDLEEDRMGGGDHHH